MAEALEATAHGRLAYDRPPNALIRTYFFNIQTYSVSARLGGATGYRVAAAPEALVSISGLSAT